MSLVSQSIKNLKGGVSQQPDILRYEDQGEVQINCFSSEAQGLQKRPPTKHIARLGKQFDLGHAPMAHLIHRDDSEQYAVFFTGSDIAIVNLLTGEVQPCSTPNGSAYITTANPRKDIRCVTVADYTFVINRSVKTAEGGTKTPEYFDPAREALVVVNGGQYARTFKVTINDIQFATYTTPNGEDAGQGPQCDISYIVDKLVEAFNTNVTGTAGYETWKAYAKEGYVWIRAHSGETIKSIKVVDGYNGKLAYGIRNDVQKTTDLPVYAPENYQVRVSGEAGTDQDDYWVRFDAERNIWTEMAAPSVTANYNNTTMPHAIIREADGSFTFKQLDWTHRAAGDDETNPFPSFIGETINDVFFFRNRLGFLSGENVILSESGSYFNFFPPSVAVSADSDPIDVAVSTNRISLLKFAVPFSEELVIWANHNQFVLGADGILSPTSVKLDLTTEFEVTDDARPYGIGRNVYFVSPRATHSSIRRYYAVQETSSAKNAEDITAHVPAYIPNGVFAMGGSSTENFLTALTSAAQNRVYVYKFLYVDEQVVQQSWSYWDLGSDAKILFCQMIGATMHLVVETKAGIMLERAVFTQNTIDFDTEPFRLYMDRKVHTVPASGSYDDADYRTTVYLQHVYGAIPEDGRYYAVLEDGTTYWFDPPAGGWAAVGGALHFNGDLTGRYMFIGRAYEMRYTFSRFLIKKSDPNGGQATEDIGRLQLRRAWVNYEQSGNFVMTVTNQGRLSSYTMSGQRLADRSITLGAQSINTGQFRFPIGGNAHKVTVSLTSDTPNPVSIIGAGWEGNYVRRSSGI
ncbi:tail tubular protein B [Aeromonas phage phiA014S]|uniref:Tail tubular protein B n=1 Tax=Aeromonas phage phiA014S TaxID=3119845 RepID=A0ABZ2CLV4_9CAUD